MSNKASTAHYPGYSMGSARDSKIGPETPKNGYFYPLKMDFCGYGPQAIFPVPPDRSYYYRLIRSLIKHQPLITLDILWVLLET